jgi:diguanylate cyclase (GGDEF)-like protein
LVKNIAASLVLFLINTIGYFLLSVPYWTNSTETFLEFGEIALAAVLVILIVHYFSRISQNRAKDLVNLIERLESENGHLKTELSQTQQKLIKEIETRELLELKIKDKLDADTTHRYNPQTGTLVEAAIKSVMTNEIARTQRYQRPLSLLCVRVDHFHPLLAQAGMTPGSLLSILADAFINSLRREDLIGHFGDDGFYILLPETGRYASYVVAERLRHLVEVMSLFNATDAVPLTVSIGLTSYQDQSKLNPDVFISQAVQALKEAEEHGGNWTINWHDISHTI